MSFSDTLYLLSFVGWVDGWAGAVRSGDADHPPPQSLTIPVAEQAKPRRIQVSARSRGPQPVETSGGGQASTADQPGNSRGAP
jgi:hypothetical protein